VPGFVFQIIRDDVLFYAWLGAGVILVVGLAIMLKKKEERTTSAIMRDPAIILVLVGLGLGHWAGPFLESMGDRLHYRAHRADYRRIVDSVVASVPHRPLSTSGASGSFAVDTGPPVRVAFVRSGEMSDWEGMIFDPGDSLITWQDHAEHRLIHLFDRTVLGCTRREPQWFYCATQPPLKRPGAPRDTLDRTFFRLQHR
jgi:hypothetical protein